LRPRVSTRKVAAALGSTIHSVSSMRARTRGWWSASSRKIAESGPSWATPSQPTISLWLASGSSAENAGSLAFSLSWVFQR
jgi:hypothetical protein